jgi:hypothetical protein
MDWQPELDQAIPQLVDVVRYPWDLPKSGDTDLCISCKECIDEGIAEGLATWRETRRASDGHVGWQSEPPKKSAWSTNSLQPTQRETAMEIDVM